MSSSSSECDSDGSNYHVPKKKKAMVVHMQRTQKYRVDWEEDEKFKKWLCQVEGGSAYCRACHATIKPRHASILQHHHTNKHARNLQDFIPPDAQITYIVEAEGWPAPTTFVADLPTVPSELVAAASASATPTMPTPPSVPPRIKKEPKIKKKDHSDHKRFDEYAFKQKFAQTKTKNKQTQTQIYNKKMELLDLQLKLEQEVADKKKCLLDAEINIKLVELEIKKLQFDEMKKATMIQIHHHPHNNMPV